jgi:hypothetical protein
MHSGATVDDRLGGSAFAETDNRAAACLGLDGNHAEILTTRKNESAAVAVEIAKASVGDLAQKLDRRPCACA